MLLSFAAGHRKSYWSGCIKAAVVICEQIFSIVSLWTAQSTAWLRASLRTALTPTLNFSCRPHGKAAAVSRWDGKEIEWHVEEKSQMRAKKLWHEMNKHEIPQESRLISSWCAEKRWEKLRWHEKRREQLWSAEKSWGRERKHEMRWGEKSWEDMRWVEMIWNDIDCDDTGMQWAISRRSCDAMRSDDMPRSKDMASDWQVESLLLLSTGVLPVTYRDSLCSAL